MHDGGTLLAGRAPVRTRKAPGATSREGDDGG
jgi:hypothetical protein